MASVRLRIPFLLFLLWANSNASCTLPLTVLLSKTIRTNGNRFFQLDISPLAAETAQQVQSFQDKVITEACVPSSLPIDVTIPTITNTSAHTPLSPRLTPLSSSSAGFTAPATKSFLARRSSTPPQSIATVVIKGEGTKEGPSFWDDVEKK
ncbi:hypothetical protein BU17DRAFT_83165 [Hysterangium stoloniferum]|nr:hypothetical protein BU17DRAFT_83165 [Hysterangium stoloniferum]